MDKNLDPAFNDQGLKWDDDEIIQYVDKAVPKSRVSTLRFRSVCAGWRRFRPKYAPREIRLPEDDPFLPKSTYFLNQDSILQLQPLNDEEDGGWVCRLRDSGDNSFEVKNHLVAGMLLDEKRLCTKAINLADYAVKEIAMVDRIEEIFRGQLRTIEYADHKIISTEKRGLAVMRSERDIEGCKVFYWHEGHEFGWTGLDAFLVEDIVVHKGTFYAVIEDGTLCTLDPVDYSKSLSECKLSLIQCGNPAFFKGKKKVLISFKEELYLVCYIEATDPEFDRDHFDKYSSYMKMKVFTWGRDLSWAEVSRLNGIMLILNGSNLAFGMESATTQNTVCVSFGFDISGQVLVCDLDQPERACLLKRSKVHYKMLGPFPPWYWDPEPSVENRQFLALQEEMIVAGRFNIAAIQARQSLAMAKWKKEKKDTDDEAKEPAPKRQK